MQKVLNSIARPKTFLRNIRLGTVVHVCNLSYLEGREKGKTVV
jgi:hypothetical protein